MNEIMSKSNNNNNNKRKNAEFYTNDYISISDTSRKGAPKRDGSGKGVQANKGRGGCSPEEQEKKDNERRNRNKGRNGGGFYQNDLFSDSPATEKTKKDNPYFYDYSGNSEDSKDFTNDGSSYTKDKKRTRKNMLGEYNAAARILLTGKKNSPEWRRALKVYKELHEYILGSEDFVDDGNTFKTDKSQTKWNLVGAIAEAYHIWQNAIKTGDLETIKRAAKVYWDLKSYVTADFTEAEILELEKKTEDFTDDRGYPTVQRGITLMDQLYNLITKREMTLGNELERLLDSNNRSDKALADRFYDHRLIKSQILQGRFT